MRLSWRCWVTWVCWRSHRPPFLWGISRCPFRIFRWWSFRISLRGCRGPSSSRVITVERLSFGCISVRSQPSSTETHCLRLSVVWGVNTLLSREYFCNRNVSHTISHISHLRSGGSILGTEGKHTFLRVCARILCSKGRVRQFGSVLMRVGTLLGADSCFCE
jgi:hypothetical protein